MAPITSNVKAGLAVAAFVILLTIELAAQDTLVEPWLLTVRDGCVAIAPGQSLTAGQTVLLVGEKLGAASLPIQAVRPTSEDAQCAREFHDYPPQSVARIVLPPTIEYGVFFALTPGPNMRVLSGPPAEMSQPAVDRWKSALAGRLPMGWRLIEVLTAGYQYGPSGGHSAMEFYVGRPQLSPRGASPPIRTIEIKRFFIVDDQVLADEEYDRESGREERADTEAPQLTFENWSLSDTEQTIAFVNQDGGRRWKRLSTNIGFEGINWTAQELAPGLPITSRRYEYTPH
jgi:hypothetical protein